jgi:hypothetical protein
MRREGNGHGVVVEVHGTVFPDGWDGLLTILLDQREYVLWRRVL